MGRRSTLSAPSSPPAPAQTASPQRCASAAASLQLPPGGWDGAVAGSQCRLLALAVAALAAMPPLQLALPPFRIPAPLPPPPAALQYKLNDRAVSWEQYNRRLESFNILVKARNFLVFQVGAWRRLVGAGCMRLFAGRVCWALKAGQPPDSPACPRCPQTKHAPHPPTHPRTPPRAPCFVCRATSTTLCTHIQHTHLTH